MRAAIIGCGLIGSNRASALPKDVELVGCFDESNATAENFAAKFGTISWNSIEDLLSTPRLDFVIVATRHDALNRISNMALNAGVNVFVEKPGAINFAQLLEVQTKAAEMNLKVHVGYNHKYHPGIKKAFEIFDEGEIGNLMFLRARYGHGGRIGYEKEWRADKSKSGGGELIDQGTHLIDLSLSFMGDITLDYASTPNYFWEMPVEDNAFLSLKNSSGSVSFLHASCTEWKNMFSMEIYGKNGKIEISGLGRSYGLETLTLYKMLPEMGPPLSQTWTFPEPDNSWGEELNDFIQDLLTGSNLSENLESSLEVLRIIDEIYIRTNR